MGLKLNTDVSRQKAREEEAKLSKSCEKVKQLLNDKQTYSKEEYQRRLEGLILKLKEECDRHTTYEDREHLFSRDDIWTVLERGDKRIEIQMDNIDPDVVFHRDESYYLKCVAYLLHYASDAGDEESFGIILEASGYQALYSSYYGENHSIAYDAVTDHAPKMLDFLADQGVQLEADRLEEVCCRIYTEEECRYGAGELTACQPYGYGRRQLLGKNCDSDPLCPAIFTADPVMIRYIAQKVPVLYWNIFLEERIVISDEKTTKLLLELFPEIVEFISMEDLFLTNNRVLLEALKERGGPVLEKKREEFLTVLRDKDRTKKLLLLACRKDILILNRYDDKLAAYLKSFAEAAPGKEAAYCLRRRIYRDLEQGGSLQSKWYSLAQLFFELAPDEPEDFTDEILNREAMREWSFRDPYRTDLTVTCKALRVLGKWKKKPFLKFRPDRITEVENTLGDGSLTIAAPEAIIRCAMAVDVSPEPDNFIKSIVEKNSLGLTRIAARNGYITPDNALGLYEYAAQLHENEITANGQVIHEEILQLLLQIAGTKGMEGRV
ncbi:MAG: hypothetical protein LUI10_05960 [Lachnospiraceae bacterium]|nr:hypothetical protein [Lachnospiraceae bacterium]